MISFRTLAGSSLVTLLGAAATALMPSSTLAAAGQHATLASFQQNVRADVLLEPFNGATGPTLPIDVSGNGYAYSASQTTSSIITRIAAFGVGAQSSDAATRFTLTGKPATAFGGTFRRIDSNLVSIGGTISVQTDTGESFTVTAAVGGTFFGFTVTQPFSTVTLETSVPGQGLEYIDDVYVGTSGTAVIPADNCADAVCISPITAVLYPFTTVGATATPIAGSCAQAPVLDNGPDVWFRFVATATGNVDLTTCGANFDTLLRVFDSCTSAAHLVCNDDFCTGGAGNLASRVGFRCQAGEDYLIRISGYNNSTGSGNLAFSVVPDCSADFNHSSTLEVQDIFDYLNAWFGGCP